MVKSFNIPDTIAKYGGKYPSGNLNAMRLSAAGPLTVLTCVFIMASPFLRGRQRASVSDPTSSLSKHFGENFEIAKVSLEELTSTIYGWASDLDIVINSR